LSSGLFSELAVRGAERAASRAEWPGTQPSDRRSTNRLITSRRRADTRSTIAGAAQRQRRGG